MRKASEQAKVFCSVKQYYVAAKLLTNVCTIHTTAPCACRIPSMRRELLFVMRAFLTLTLLFRFLRMHLVLAESDP